MTLMNLDTGVNISVWLRSLLRSMAVETNARQTVAGFTGSTGTGYGFSAKSGVLCSACPPEPSYVFVVKALLSMI